MTAEEKAKIKAEIKAEVDKLTWDCAKSPSRKLRKKIIDLWKRYWEVEYDGFVKPSGPKPKEVLDCLWGE